MHIIALIGPENRGKSETLNAVYHFLTLFGFIQDPDHFRVLGNKINKDCLDILVRGQHRVCIAMMGDYPKGTKGISIDDTIEAMILYADKQQCTVCICACRDDFHGTLEFIRSFPSTEIQKTIALAPSQRKVNGDDAARIISFLGTLSFP